MKKKILAAAIVCAFATGMVATSFAQSTSTGSQGAGTESGAKSDTTGANPSNSNGTTAGQTNNTGSGR